MSTKDITESLPEWFNLLWVRIPYIIAGTTTELIEIIPDNPFNQKYITWIESHHASHNSKLISSKSFSMYCDIVLLPDSLVYLDYYQGHFGGMEIFNQNIVRSMRSIFQTLWNEV